MEITKRTMSKYRTLFAIIILACISSNLVHAQVDEDELQNLPPVVFINYEGPYARIDTREQIRQLGYVLGQQIAEREGALAPTLEAMSLEERRAYTYRFETGPLNRYFVIHCVSCPEDGKLDADIFGLGVDTAVDHVRNLRTIVQGYLQAAYDYSERDAALLAEYITIYNAVYRGNWEFFVERYKTLVINNLIRERAGLSIRYDEWPGRTMMLIPLGHGGLSAIDTAAISDRRVIEELRREDDRGVPQRQDMVDLMEREAERAEQQARTERETARQEERRITQERQQTAQERQRIEEQQRAGTIAEEEARRRQEELDRREEELARQEQENQQRLEEAQRLEEFAEERFDTAQEHREEIARDQQEVIIQETTGGILGVTIEREDPVAMGRLVRFNPITGSEIRRSPLDTVHVRTVTFIAGKIIAIAGEQVEPGAVRIIEITQDTLVMAKQGDDDIRTGSLLWVNGGDLYAIIADGDNNFLGRFDTNLELQAKSEVMVHRGASVTIQQGRLLTQNEYGSPLILNPADLTELFN